MSLYALVKLFRLKQYNFTGTIKTLTRAHRAKGRVFKMKFSQAVKTSINGDEYYTQEKL